MRRQAVARPNGQERQREADNRGPPVSGIQKRNASKLVAELPASRAL